MKLIYLIESFNGGGKERRLLELIDSLNKSDLIKFKILVLNKLNKYSYVKVKDFSKNIHFLKHKNPFLVVKEIHEHIKEFKPDLIHSWAYNTSIFSIFSKLRLKIPLIDSSISTATDINSIFHKQYFINKLIFFFSDLIISNSNAGLKSYDPPKHKSLFIHNGFNFKRLDNLCHVITIRDKFDISTTNIIGMFATFSKKKDYHTYIKAALLVLKEFDDISFLCVGKGDSTNYQKLIPSKFSSKIIFLNNQIDVESLMNICNFTVLSTYTEGISNSIMESMALKKPVIATSGGGTNEIIIDDVNGYLIPKNSPFILSKKIIFLLNNPRIVYKFGLNSYGHINANFSISQMVNLTHDQYLKILNFENQTIKNS